MEALQRSKATRLLFAQMAIRPTVMLIFARGFDLNGDTDALAVRSTDLLRAWLHGVVV